MIKMIVLNVCHIMADAWVVKSSGVWRGYTLKEKNEENGK
jgi:hypothetical protein